MLKCFFFKRSSQAKLIYIRKRHLYKYKGAAGNGQYDELINTSRFAIVLRLLTARN